ncbi:hypothetical protein V7S43_003195 [Phytophthora oleae]|uniref:ALMS motif domain-containing protein n=1 Tax=Phytophthora oleae TaxID=2107226 RepID=A0ABD3FXZ5_9STRA
MALSSRAPRNRRRRDASLGQIPLSSGEIELYSRQDEAARQRRRLLAVREQERRLAQQVTQRYRDNLQKLQRNKSRKTRKQLNAEQEKMLTELHIRYKNSLQSMGTAQRNARLKLLELMEQAQEEKEKWTYNRQITGKQRIKEAEEAQEEEEKVRTQRRRQVEQNMERLKVLSGQQRQQASARARKEQDVATQRAKDREEIERLRRMQSPEEVFVTPRPHEKDVLSYHFTRTHCLATPNVEKERPVVTVIRHNRRHATAMRGEEEAEKYREEMDQKRERDRVIAEEQGEIAAQRGQGALGEITSKQQGQQALEWLALVDKMERRVRGQELGGEDYSLDTWDVGGELDDPERMAERAFAQLLGLGDDSADLSVFSIETDDDQSVGLGDTDRDNSDGDKVTDVENRVKLKAAKRRKPFASLDEVGDRRPTTDAEDEEAEGFTPVKPQKAATFGDLQREELEKWSKANARGKSAHPGVGRPLKPAVKYEDNLGKTGTNLVNDGGNRVNKSPDRQQLQSASREIGANTVTSNDRSRGRYEKERPEGTDSEEDESDHSADRLRQDDISIGQLENRLQQVLDLRLSRPEEAQPLVVDTSEGDRASLSSGSDVGERVSQPDDVTAGDSRNIRPSGGFSNIGDSSRKANGSFVSEAFKESNLPSFPATPEIAASSVRYSSSSVDGGSVEHADILAQSEYHEGSGHDSRVAVPMDQDDDRRSSKGDALPIYRGEEPKERVRDDYADVSVEADGQPSIAGDTRLSYSTASSRSRYYGEHEHNEAGHGEDIHLPGLRGQPAVVAQSKPEAAAFDRETASPDLQDHGARRMSRHSAEEMDPSLLGSRDTGSGQGLIDERDEHLSSGRTNQEFHDAEAGVQDKLFDGISIDEDQQSVSESSFAPSQMSLSRLDEVANARAKMLRQQYIDQNMMSFSFSEGDSDDEGEAGERRSTIDHANSDPYDPYRQQIDHQARRSSTSAVSVAQYSLPPSDTQSSFDDSLDRLHPGHGDDSFVNELVPMFPKRGLPPPPHVVEEDNRAVKEYDVQLDAPKMSRMLTSERRRSFGRSRQHVVRYDPKSDPTERSRPSVGAGTSSERSFSSSERSLSTPSSSEIDAESVHAKVEKSPDRQPVSKQARAASAVDNDDVQRTIQAHAAEDSEIDNRSDVSGVSSLGFAVKLNMVAGTTRRRQGEAPIGDRQGRNQNVDDELDKQSERSFSSDSSMSMDAHFKYLANMTSAVGKSLPLHLRIPAMVYGKKDMTKPPAPMAWSASSIASSSEADPDESLERRSVHQSSMSESQHGSETSGGSSGSKSTGESRTKRLAIDSIKDQVSKLLPSPMRPQDMSRPPPPMQIFSRHLDESQASSEQSDDGRHQLPPPPLASLNMSQPPPRRSFHDTNDSRSSSEENSGDTRRSWAQEERKHDDSSASDSSFSSSTMKKAARIEIPVTKRDTEEISLAEAFQRRHPGFNRRLESHRDKLKRQREMQQQEKPIAVKLDTAKPSSPRGRSTADDLPPEKHTLLDRLASGSRAKISSREMKERSRRLYHQLPEVVERKRQEEVMRRRRERLNELREQEKARRLEQKERREQRR